MATAAIMSNDTKKIGTHTIGVCTGMFHMEYGMSLCFGLGLTQVKARTHISNHVRVLDQ